ncbi:hypothetical protein RDABS01_012643, partial [Bienertia sinuspersici]
VKKNSTSKQKSSTSSGKKKIISTAQANNEVVIDYYDIDFNGDAQFKENYDKLFKRVVSATRYCYIDALKALHIEDDVRWLFSNVGRHDFLTAKYPTYKRVTLEFLSSLKGVVKPGLDGMVTFRLYNAKHTWKLSHLDEVLGLPTEGPRLTSKYWDANQIWRRMGPGTDFDSKGCLNYLIRHPALRYVHKVLANTIFGHEENSKVRRDEIYMLEHMLHAKPIDIGSFLIWQMLSIVKKETTSCALVLGSLITPTSLHLGHRDRLIQDGLVEGSDSIDFFACSSMGWIHKKEGTILWHLGNDDEEELPPPEAMTLRVQENWSFRPM